MPTEHVVLKDAKGRPTHVVVPIAEWRRLREQAEAAHLDELLAQDSIPHKQAMRIVDGERPLKVFREWRGLGQTELARRAGLAQPTIAQLESGKRKGTVQQMRKLARALDLQLETLVGWKADEQATEPGTSS